MNSQQLYELGTQLLERARDLPTSVWEEQAKGFLIGYKALTEGQREYFWAEHQGQKYNVNQSRLTQFANCKRKYWWQFEENLVPDRPQYPLDFGKAAHEGLAALNSDMPLAEALTAATASFDKSMMLVSKMPGEQDLVKKHRDYLVELITAYVERWGEGGDEWGWTVLKPEVQGKVEVGEGTGCFLTFRTDAIVSWRRAAFLLEHKTMAQNRMDNWLKYEMDFQITAYIYALTKLLGIRINGVIVNGLVKTTTPQFGREMYTRSDAELMEFEEEFVEQVRELAWRKQRVANGEPFKRVFYKNTQECFRYGQCPYRSLCLKDSPNQRLMFIKRTPDYVDNPALLEVKHDRNERPIKEARADQGRKDPGSRPGVDPSLRHVTERPSTDTSLSEGPSASAASSRKPTWGDFR